MIRGRQSVVFKAEIGFFTDGRDADLPFDHKRFGEHPLEELLDLVRTVIHKDLCEHMEQVFSIKIEAKITKHEIGSLTVFFTVTFAALSAIASYKNFYDSVKLIREQCKDLLERRITQRFGYHMYFIVDQMYPNLASPNNVRRRRPLYDLIRQGDFEIEDLFGIDRESRPTSRDAFFWFLLVLVLLLGAAVVALVWSAVMSTYFGTPN